jgi:hypothetical protein
MLKHSTAVLRSQLGYIMGNKRYEDAYKSGVRVVQDYYGEPLMDLIIKRLRSFEWKQAVRDIFFLLRYAPQMFVKHTWL